MTNQSERNAGWFIIGTACLLLLMSFGYRSGFGLFLKPMTDANDWGRETVSIALAVQNLVWGVVAMFAGGLADRFGNVKVIVSGALLYIAGMVLMAGVQDKWLLQASMGILVGAGIAGTSFGIVLPAMARAVPEEKRQWALGVGTAAGSMGQFVIVPISQWLIDLTNWTQALYLLSGSAVLMIFLAIPLAPYSGMYDRGAQDQDQTIREALKEAFSHRSYVLLVAGFFVCGFHIAFITAHMPAFITDAGFAPAVGAWSISLIGLCNVVGAYTSGVTSGKLAKVNVLVFIYLGRAVAISAFLLVPLSLASILVFSAVMGFLWLATVPPTTGLVAVMFGTRYMALLYGVVFLGHQLGSFVGIWLGGWLYDNTGSYNGIWYAGILLGIAAAFMHWPIDERPVGRFALKSS